MRKILLLLTSLIILQNLSAQVKGVAVDSASKNPLDGAIVGLVVKANISDTTYTITNDKGEFSFDKVPATNFSIILTNLSYRPVAKLIIVDTLIKIIDLGNISLANRATLLNEIVIEIPPVTIKEDTVEYRADAFKVKENAVVEDLLKKLPGIQVDKDGNITAQGKKITKVKVNGKDFFGGDVNTATKELPANIVDKIQIVDDYGDQATVSGIKDGEAEKVLNIQLKKDKNVGYFGRFTLGAGNKNRYHASFSGNYFKDDQQFSLFTNSNNSNQSLFNFNSGNRGGGSGQGMNDLGGSGSMVNAPGNGDQGFLQGGSSSLEGITSNNSIGINYRDKWSKKLSVYGSYSFGFRNSQGFKILSQQNIFQDKIYINNQNSNFENKGQNHRLFFNMDYNIDSFNYIKISPSVSFAASDGFNKVLFDYFTDASGKTSEGYSNTFNESKAPNVSTNILFNHRFRKKGRNFSANINLGNSGNSSDQDALNNTVRYIPTLSSVNNFLFNNQENQNRNYGIRLTYSEPLSKVRFLDVALSHNFSFARNNKQTFDIDPSTGFQTFNSFLSNDYENNYFTNRANISVRTTQKKYNYTVGLSFHPVKLQGYSNTKDSAYKTIKRVNIFPVARFAYNFSKTMSLSVNYRGDAQQPGFSQLQDVRDSSNLQYQRNGNPNLRPSINHSINASFNKFNFASGNILFTSLSFTTIQNQIIYKITQLDSAGAQLSVPQNVSGYYNTNAYYNLSKPYNNKKVILSVNGRLNYTNNINLIDEFKTTGKNWVVSQGFIMEINHKDWLEVGVGVNYNLNSVTYSNTQSKTISFQDQQYGSWSFGNNASITIPKDWVLKYDFDYTLNTGLAMGVNKNITLLNASLEKQLFKKKTGIIRLQGFDLFNQNSGINRSVSANSIIDVQSNRLTRYFMLTFIYRLQKFAGKQQQPKNSSNNFPTR